MVWRETTENLLEFGGAVVDTAIKLRRIGQSVGGDHDSTSRVMLRQAAENLAGAAKVAEDGGLDRSVIKKAILRGRRRYKVYP